ncbi:MAG: IS200/IS605 family transposase [Prolixibacteraceae bacterium]|jgi:putative transposase|nr:IS200/IS605 family transposase [Prolixibacteraceae bacterium]
MSYVKIWVHLVFATKNREYHLPIELGHAIHEHIISNCIKKEIFLQAIGGSVDHVHCLISLGKDQAIAQVVQSIKGESSFWINKNHILSYKFSWQDDYFAVSVSESLVGIVMKYIKNQEEHHRFRSFPEEAAEFISKYGFKLIHDE